MKFYKKIPVTLIFIIVLSLLFINETMAKSGEFKKIVVFGASLSDAGNAFIVQSNPADFGFTPECGLGTPLNVPPYDSLDELNIPDGTYAKGGHHVTNGATWVEQMARGEGLSGSVRPALRNNNLQASNYAVGGARASEFPCRFNLVDQLDVYLSDFATTSADTLVAFEIGGNDVRDALIALSLGQDPKPIIESALTNIATTVFTLYQQGARNV